MSVKPETVIMGLPLSKRDYLEQQSHRISFEADGDALWNAYEGSHALASSLWRVYERRGRLWGVGADVAGVALMNGVGVDMAAAACGVRRRVIG